MGNQARIFGLGQVRGSKQLQLCAQGLAPVLPALSARSGGQQSDVRRACGTEHTNGEVVKIQWSRAVLIRGRNGATFGGHGLRGEVGRSPRLIVLTGP